MKKTASVYTNDKNRSRMDLAMSGQVEKFVTIRPKHINLRGYTGDSIKALVSVIPEKKYPFKILKISAKDGKKTRFGNGGGAGGGPNPRVGWYGEQ